MRELAKISAAMLVTTHECNLRCRYCFVQKEPRRMSLQTAKDAARFLIDNARAAGGVTPEINFFGGEPMLEFERVIRPLAEWVHGELGERCRFSITTNGTLLTEENIRFMRRHGFGLLLSMDGAKEVQDYNRPLAGGGGSFELLRPIVPLVLAAWPAATFRMTAIPASCERSFEGALWAEAQGFRSFFITPNVFEPWDGAAREALSAGLGRYARHYAESRAAGGRPIRFTELERAEAQLDELEEAERRGAYRSSPRCRAAGKCGLGASRWAAVHPDGGLYACQELTSSGGEDSPFYIGSIYSGADNGRRRALMGSFDALPAGSERCAHCELDRICDGGCAANNFLATGRLGEPPEVYCWWRRELLKWAKWIREAEKCPR